MNTRECGLLNLALPGPERLRHRTARTGRGTGCRRSKTVTMPTRLSSSATRTGRFPTSSMGMSGVAVSVDLVSRSAWPTVSLRRSRHLDRLMLERAPEVPDEAHPVRVNPRWREAVAVVGLSSCSALGHTFDLRAAVNCRRSFFTLGRALGRGVHGSHMSGCKTTSVDLGGDLPAPGSEVLVAVDTALQGCYSTSAPEEWSALLE